MQSDFGDLGVGNSVVNCLRSFDLLPPADGEETWMLNSRMIRVHIKCNQQPADRFRENPSHGRMGISDCEHSLTVASQGIRKGSIISDLNGFEVDRSMVVTKHPCEIEANATVARDQIFQAMLAIQMIVQGSNTSKFLLENASSTPSTVSCCMDPPHVRL
jgi:hypothetical protein